MTALYRWYDTNDQLLYIGITDHLPKRTRTHDRNKPWWTDVAHSTVEHFDSRYQALAAESAAIATEHPRYNIMGAVRRDDTDLEPIDDIPQAPSPVAVSITEAARMLGISRSQAYTLARANEIPTIRSLGKLVVPVRWIEAQAATAIADWERSHAPLRAVAS